MRAVTYIGHWCGVWLINGIICCVPLSILSSVDNTNGNKCCVPLNILSSVDNTNGNKCCVPLNILSSVDNTKCTGNIDNMILTIILNF